MTGAHLRRTEMAIRLLLPWLDWPERAEGPGFLPVSGPELSPRQTQALRLLAGGMMNARIADAMGVGEATASDDAIRRAALHSAQSPSVHPKPQSFNVSRFFKKGKHRSQTKIGTYDRCRTKRECARFIRLQNDIQPFAKPEANC